MINDKIQSQGLLDERCYGLTVCYLSFYYLNINEINSKFYLSKF